MRVQPNLDRELELMEHGHRCIAGIDEAGRGALAGPVVAAAVILPLDRFDLARALSEVRDSKQLTSSARDRCDEQIRELAIAVGIGEASAKEVDKVGLMPATLASMQRAVEALEPTPSFLLIDHIGISALDIDQEPITRGDQSVLSIAAASVVAKVWRDKRMIELGERFTGYGFQRHKGYGTAQHRQALESLGPCPAHRRSYAPVQLAQKQ
ncbi:MAG: ribonuclease HII [Anaerolineales bacterium]